LGSGAVLGRGGRSARISSSLKGSCMCVSPIKPSPRRGRRCRQNPWSIAALHVLTTLTGSALLALALLRGVLDEDQVWSAAHVDEDWNSEQWGVDGEVMARRAARLTDFRAAAKVLKALGPHE